MCALSKKLLHVTVKVNVIIQQQKRSYQLNEHDRFWDDLITYTENRKDWKTK